jgi:hypothetical protein
LAPIQVWEWCALSVRSDQRGLRFRLRLTARGSLRAGRRRFQGRAWMVALVGVTFGVVLVALAAALLQVLVPAQPVLYLFAAI